MRASKIEIVECLLKSGCEVNAQTKGSKATALHRACMKGRPEIVQLLLSKLLPLSLFSCAKKKLFLYI